MSDKLINLKDNKMETPELDKQIELRECLEKDGSISPESKKALIEFKAIKEQLKLYAVMQAQPEKCEHINYQMDSDGFDVCDDCGKTLF